MIVKFDTNEFDAYPSPPNFSVWDIKFVTLSQAQLMKILDF